MKTLILAIFMVTAFFCSAQKQGQARMDSLVLELPNIANDTIKGRMFKTIAEEYFFIDVNKALEYSRYGLKHVSRMKWERGIAVFNSIIGRAYGDMGNYDSCLIYYQKALAIHKKANDKINMSSVLNNLGAAEQNMTSNYTKAIQYYFEALKLAEFLNDKYLIATCFDNISSIYLYQKNYEKSLDYAFKSLKNREIESREGEISKYRDFGNSISTIAAIYTEMNDVKKAEDYHQKALIIHTKVGNKQGLAKTYTNLAYLAGNHYQSKIEYNLKAKEIYDELSPNHLSAINNLANLGIAYFELVKSADSGIEKLTNIYRGLYLQKAENYLLQAIRLSEQNGEISFKNNFVGNLAQLQALKGDYKSAYANMNRYHQVQDSIFSQESKNAIAEIESKREIALRDKEIEINKLALEVQKKQRIGMFAALLLLMVIGILLFWQNRTRKRTNTTLLHLNNELDEANKIKAKFFGILSHDLRSPVANLISFLHLQKEEPELLSPELSDMHQKRITESAETLLENMESMLLWSKGQMKNFKPQLKQIEVSELFDYLKKFFSDTSNVAFGFENPSGLKLNTDEDYLRTIMQNLTNNAVKVLKNTANATIKWEAKFENNQITLSITDNGPGISEKQLDVLYTEESVVSSKTGLGLHLIRDLAKAIACNISVKSKPGMGSEFQLILFER